MRLLRTLGIAPAMAPPPSAVAADCVSAKH